MTRIYWLTHQHYHRHFGWWLLARSSLVLELTMWCNPTSRNVPGNESEEYWGELLISHQQDVSCRGEMLSYPLTRLTCLTYNQSNTSLLRDQGQSNTTLGLPSGGQQEYSQKYPNIGLFYFLLSIRKGGVRSTNIPALSSVWEGFNGLTVVSGADGGVREWENW